MSINLFLWVFLFSQIFKSFYPEKYDNFNRQVFFPILNYMNDYLIEFFYKCLYFYSVLQIKIIKINQIISPYYKIAYEILNYILIENNIISNNNNVKTIVSFYSDKNILKIIEYSSHYSQIFTSNLETPDNCSLITIEDNSLESSTLINIICLHNIPETINFIVSTYKFLSFECIYNDVTYNIELKTNKYNFYITDTIIDKYFIKYYLENILQYNFDNNCMNENFTYKLLLIDHNVNCIQLTELDSIYIKKDDYILNNNAEQYNNNYNNDNNDNNDNNERSFSDEKDWVISENE